MPDYSNLISYLLMICSGVFWLEALPPFHDGTRLPEITCNCECLAN